MSLPLWILCPVLSFLFEPCPSVPRPLLTSCYCRIQNYLNVTLQAPPPPHLSATVLKSLNKTPKPTFRLPSSEYSMFAWHYLSLNSTIWALDLGIVLLLPPPRRAMFPRLVPWRDVQISDLCGCRNMCAREGSGWYALSRRKTIKLLRIIK